MIASLRGSVTSIFAEGVVIDVQGVGFRVLTPPLTGAAVGKEIFLHTHLCVREDSWQLFGFPEPEQLELFQLLITVSGIGPKVALGILSATSVLDFWQAIAAENATILTRIPGIGRKTAQRLVVELKDRVPELVAVSDQGFPGQVTAEPALYQEARMALVNLGYHPGEVQTCLREVAKKLDSGASLEEIIRQALRGLARL